jgi:hypothetical protein
MHSADPALGFPDSGDLGWSENLDPDKFPGVVYAASLGPHLETHWVGFQAVEEERTPRSSKIPGC